MTRFPLLTVFLFCLTTAQLSAQSPVIPCDDLFRRAQQLHDAGQLSDAMNMLDAVTSCDQDKRFETRVTALRVTISNELKQKDSLLTIEQQNLIRQQNANRFRSSLLYANLAQTALGNRNFNAAWLYLSRAMQDSVSDKTKALLLPLSQDHYTYMKQLKAGGNAKYTCIAMHPLKKILVAGGTDSSLAIYDFSSLPEQIRMKNFAGRPLKVAFSEDGSTLAIGLTHQPTGPVNGQSGAYIILLSTENWVVIGMDSLVNEFCGINDLVFADNNRKLVMTSACQARVLDFAAHTNIPLSSSGVTKLAFCGDNHYAGLLNELLYFWDLSSPGQPEKKISLHSFNTRTTPFYSTGCLAAVPGTHKLLIGLTTGNFVEYNWDNDQLTALPFSQSAGINDIRFVDAHQLISCSTDNSVCCWDYPTGVLREEFSNARLGFMALALGKTQGLLATLEYTDVVNSNIGAGKVKIWTKTASPLLLTKGRLVHKVEFAANMDSLSITYSDSAGPPRFGSPAIHMINHLRVALKDVFSTTQPPLVSWSEKPDTGRSQLQVAANDAVLLQYTHSNSLQPVTENCFTVRSLKDTTIQKKICFPSGDKMEWQGLVLSPNGKYLALPGWGGTLLVLETTRFTRMDGMFSPTPLGIPCHCSFSADSRYLGCTMGAYLFLHDFIRSRNDTIQHDQMIVDFSFVRDPAIVILSDSRQNTRLFRLGDNFEDLSSLQDMPLFKPAGNGKFLFYASNDGFHLTPVNYPPGVPAAEHKTNLKLQFNNELTPLDP